MKDARWAVLALAAMLVVAVPGPTADAHFGLIGLPLAVAAIVVGATFAFAEYTCETAYTLAYAGCFPSPERGGSVQFRPGPGYDAHITLPLAFECAVGVEAEVRFMVPADAPVSGRIGILDLTQEGGYPDYAVFSLSMVAPDRLHAGDPAGPFDPEGGFHVAPGAWHHVRVTADVALGTAAVSVDGGAPKSFPLLTSRMPDRLRVGASGVADENTTFFIDDLKVGPLLARNTDGFAKAWPAQEVAAYTLEIGATNELNATVFHDAPPSQHVKTTGMGDNRRLSLWKAAGLPTCSAPHVFGFGTSVWFHLPEGQAWGDAFFALTQVTDAAPPSYSDIVYQVGDFDGDRKLDVQFDTSLYHHADYTPGLDGEVTTVPTGVDLPFGGWHRLETYVRPAADVVDLAELSSVGQGMFRAGYARTLEVRLDGAPVGAYPLAADDFPTHVYLGDVHTTAGRFDDYDVYWDDYATRVDAVGEICHGTTRYYGATTFDLRFETPWMHGPSAIVERTIDAGYGPIALDAEDEATVTFPEDGAYTVYYNMTLDDGRVLSEPCTVVVDRVAPTTGVDLRTEAYSGSPPPAMGEDGWYLEPFAVVFRATDDRSGVDKLHYRHRWHDGRTWEWYVDGQHSSSDPNKIGYTTTYVGAGTRSFEWWATDLAGNVEPAGSLGVKVDVRPPKLDAAASGTSGRSGWWTTPVTWSFVASDPAHCHDGGYYEWCDHETPTSGVASHEVRLDGGPWTTAADLVVAGDGRHVVEQRAADVAGHVAPTLAYDMAIDATPPWARFELVGEPGDNGWWKGATARLRSVDNTSGVALNHLWWRNWDSGERADLRTNPAEVVLTDGSNRIAWAAHDVAGHELPAASAYAHCEGWYGDQDCWLVEVVDLRVDTRPPSARIALDPSPNPAGWIAGDRTTVTVSASDVGSGLAARWVRVDGGADVPYEAPFVVEGPGARSVETWSEDVAGHASAVHRVPFAFDADDPTVALAAPPASPTGWHRVGERVLATAADGTSGVARLLARVDGGGWGLVGASSGSLALVEGEHVAEFQAVDRAGRASLVGAFAYRADGTAPTVTVDPPEGSVRNLWAGGDGYAVVAGPTLNVTGTASDAGSGVARVSAFLDGTPVPVVGTTRWSAEADAVEPGVYELVVVVEDAVGLRHERAGTVLVV